MIILYINAIETNKGWGAECFVNHGFNFIGNTTITIDYRKNRYQLYNIFNTLNEKFDVFFLQRGEGFPLDIIKSINTPRFFWASELVSRCRDQDRLLKSGLFNHIFVHSNNCMQAIIKKKWVKENQVSVLLNGFDDDIHKKNDHVKKDINVLFVGRLNKRRKKILGILENNDLPITIASAFGSEMTNLFNRSKIILNIHASDNLDTETRIFEALGCGCFVISEKLSVENPFIKNKHYIEVNDINEMITSIKYFLKNDSQRIKIAQNGYEEAQQKHSYKIRAKYLSNVFSNYLDNSTKNDVLIFKDKIKKYKYKENILKLISILKNIIKSIIKKK